MALKFPEGSVQENLSHLLGEVEIVGYAQPVDTQSDHEALAGIGKKMRTNP